MVFECLARIHTSFKNNAEEISRKFQKTVKTPPALSKNIRKQNKKQYRPQKCAVSPQIHYIGRCDNFKKQNNPNWPHKQSVSDANVPQTIRHSLHLFHRRHRRPPLRPPPSPPCEGGRSLPPAGPGCRSTAPARKAAALPTLRGGTVTAQRRFPQERFWLWRTISAAGRRRRR